MLIRQNEPSTGATTDAPADANAAKKPAVPAEPAQFALSNMTRVTPHQAPLVSFTSERYTPLRPVGDASAIAAAREKEKSRQAAAAALEKETKETEGGATATTNVGVKAARPSVSANGLGFERRLAGGSIVLLRDNKAGDEGEGDYVELSKTLWPRNVDEGVVGVPGAQVGQEGQEGAGQMVGQGQEEEETDAEIPPAFEYPFED